MTKQELECYLFHTLLLANDNPKATLLFLINKKCYPWYSSCIKHHEEKQRN